MKKQNPDQQKLQTFLVIAVVFAVVLSVVAISVSLTGQEQDPRSDALFLDK